MKKTKILEKLNNPKFKSLEMKKALEVVGGRLKPVDTYNSQGGGCDTLYSNGDVQFDR